MKLYEISNELRQLLEVDNEAYADTLEGLQLEFQEKADSVACYIKELQAEAEAIKAEERSLAERRKAKESKVESLKAYLCNEMQVAGVKKIETARNVLSIRKTPAKLVVHDEEKLIEMLERDGGNDFLTVKKATLNKTAIKEAIMNGSEFYSVRLETGESFSIK